MFQPAVSRLLAVSLAWTAFATGEPVTVTDLKGRSIGIEVLAVANGNVSFRRTGNPKEFVLPVSDFDEASRDLINKQPAELPKITADVVLGKRRRDVGDSYYMEKQEITATVKLTNPSNTIPVTGLSGTLVYIGQNTRTPALYTVLSSQKFEAAINAGATYSKELEIVTTSYDSDNKGANNIGGYQYFGYVLVLLDAAGNVVLNQATAGSFKQALAAKPALAKEVIKYSNDQSLNEKLVPLADGVKLRVPR